MLVEVKGSFGADGWHQGEYEGHQGVVLSVADTSKNDFSSTALVKFFEPLDPAQPTLSVPVQHLWPVHPEKVEEDVLMLHGVYKGSLAKVYAVDGSTNMIVRTVPALVVVDTAPDTLVRRWNIDTDGNRVAA